MSAKTFVDTNVLIYAHDADAGMKHEAAKDVLRKLVGPVRRYPQHPGSPRVLRGRNTKDRHTLVETLRPGRKPVLHEPDLLIPSGEPAYLCQSLRAGKKMMVTAKSAAAISTTNARTVAEMRLKRDFSAKRGSSAAKA